LYEKYLWRKPQEMYLWRKLQEVMALYEKDAAIDSIGTPHRSCIIRSCRENCLISTVPVEGPV
jgi:hypothetical protein